MMRVVLLLCSLAFVAGIPIPERRWTSISDHWQINLSDQSDNLKNAYNLLHMEIESYVDGITGTVEQEEARETAIRRISAALEEQYPGCEVNAFGSYAERLHLPDGDIDLTLNCPDSYIWENATMELVGEYLASAGVVKNVEYVLGARIPVIKFTDSQTDIDVDLSFNNREPLLHVPLVQQYVHEMPALRPLVMVLKTLFSEKELNKGSTGGLGSYPLICMVISFLQRHPAVSSGALRAHEHLGRMLHELLILYGSEFDFKTVGICIQNGGSYFDRLEYRSLLDHQWHSTRVAVRDPLFPSKNLSRSSYRIDDIVDVFREAQGALQERLEAEVEESSILGVVINAKAN